MIGQSAPLSTLVRMLGGVIHGNITIVVSHAQSSERGHAVKRMHVSMHMVYLSAGFTLLNIGPVSARMRWDATDGFVSLLTSLKNFGPCMLLLVLRCLLREHSQLVLLHWIWVQ